MSRHRATTEWTRNGAPFRYESYPRAHALRFDGGIEVGGTAAPGNIPASAPKTPGVDPEQAFVSALSACHMLWFLHLACQAGYVVDRYVDDAVGTLGKDADGRLSMTRVVLRPVVAFSGKTPSAEAHDALHHEAHEKCFIANSVRSALSVEASIANAP